MDQKKIGLFLKELRKQRGVTQEQIGEVFHVSNRTVSRWENGNNMPDLDILIELSDYYQVDLRELLDGERRAGYMNKEVEETVLKAVDYTNTATERHNKRLHGVLSVGVILMCISQIISHTSLIEIAFFNVASAFASGAACGMIVCGVISTSQFGQKLKAFKQRLLTRS